MKAPVLTLKPGRVRLLAAMLCYLLGRDRWAEWVLDARLDGVGIWRLH